MVSGYTVTIFFFFTAMNSYRFLKEAKQDRLSTQDLVLKLMNFMEDIELQFSGIEMSEQHPKKPQKLKSPSKE